MSVFQPFSLSAFCLCFFAACSPSLDDAKLVLQQRITSQSQGHIKLVSFSTTDLQEFQVKGVPGRRVHYAAEIEFDAHGTWSRWAGNPTQLNFEFTAIGRVPAGNAAEIMGDLQGKRRMGKGDRIQIVGVMTGTRSDKGWQYELGESHSTE